MRRALGLTAVAVGLLAVFTVDVAAQGKNRQGADKQVAEMATDQDYKLLGSIKDMTGKLVSINTMSVTFRLDIPHLDPNPKYKPPKGNNRQYQQLQNIYRQQAKIMATRDPFVRQMKMQQLMATMQKDQYLQMMQAAAANGKPNNQPFLLAHQYKDFELELAENVIVRKMFLESEYDDKGNLKTLTKEEKADLRAKDPNPTKPGYQAKMEDLQAGLQVKVYLKMPKKTKPASESDKAEDKAQGKDKAADKTDESTDKGKNADKADEKNAAKAEVVKPLITMIVILQPLDAQVADSIPAKRKKDN
jgi:hypothetical protein